MNSLRFCVYFLIFLFLFFNIPISVKSENLENVIDNTKFLITNLNNELSGEFFKQALNFTKTLTTSEISDDDICMQQIYKIYTNLLEFQPWALEFIDAWGKIPTGMLWGHLRDLGNYEECLNITKTFTDEDDFNIIQGKYCSAQVPIKEILQYINPLLNRSANINNNIGMELGIIIGICIPKMCTHKFVDEILKKILEDWNIKVEENILIDGSCFNQSEIKFEAIDWFAIAFFSFIGLIMFLSTLYDIYVQKYEKTPKQLLISFSLYTNSKKLFHIQNNNSPDVISCLNGIRCLSIIWVVFGHSYITATKFNNINIIQMLEWLQKPYAMLLIFSTVSVDSFFFLSGLLIAWGGMREMQKNKGKLNIPMMYFHRYIRLTPVLAVTILFVVSVGRYTGSGPLWNGLIKTTTESCEKNWWSTLLYVQNYAIGSDKICIPHSWYLAVDTQLYFLSPLILIPLWIWGNLCLLPIIFLCLLSMACTFTTFILHDFHVRGMGVDQGEQMSLTYHATHTRYSPWLIGIILGYYMFTKRNNRIRMSKLFLLCGWCISLATIVAVIWGPYYRAQPDSSPMPNIESAFYESCSRVSWSIALAWIVFVCHNGYGGIINTILSWKIWQPLSRLSYSIYICHQILQIIIISSSKSDHHISDFETILGFWGQFAITFLISICTVLAFESPIIGIVKACFEKGKKINIADLPRVEAPEYCINSGKNPDNISK